MRHFVGLFLLTALLALSACQVASTTVGVGVGSGVGVSLSVHNDALYNSGGAYSLNRQGVAELLDGDAAAAQKLFEAGLKRSPGNPDGVYYLGLTLLYLDESEAGYTLLASYRDRRNFRMTQEVRYWADYFRQRPESDPETVHRRMNKARAEGFRRDREEFRDRRF